ncbi:glycosyltransferase family 2 protein [Candidatus Saccharibacteria bacterium]|nr:glycosyltransferase family 2 protein [Candidatus Saccharibacteria bacterium]
MKKVKISIIVAAYNIQDYISACLESIIKQTYKNLEIIVVDDGSTDNTKKLIRTFKKQDSRIKVIHQKNSGLSAARNSGVLASTASYLCFIDGDDTISPDYVEKLYSRIYHTRADIAVCGYETISINKTESHVTFHGAETVTGRDATINLLLTQENLDVVAWNKIYKKSLFLDNSIFYPVGEIHEDNLTTYKLYSVAKKVTYLMEPLYQYYRRTGSIMDRTTTLERLKLKERSAIEAIDFFAKSDARLRASAHISLLLAKFAFIDAYYRGDIPKSYADRSLRWIKSHTSNYRKNKSLTPKLRLYLHLVNTFNSKPYALFRRFFHE